MRLSTSGLLIMLVLGVLVVPLAATAQPAAKTPQIGWLAGASAEALAPLVEAFPARVARVRLR